MFLNEVGLPLFNGYQFLTNPTAISCSFDSHRLQFLSGHHGEIISDLYRNRGLEL